MKKTFHHNFIFNKNLLILYITTAKNKNIEQYNAEFINKFKSLFEKKFTPNK